MSPSDPLMRECSLVGREVAVGPVGLGGYLVAPQAGRGMVLFAHGSGSGRESPRNQFVARALQKSGLGTLLLDLLTDAEAQDRANVFDIGQQIKQQRAETGFLQGAGYELVPWTFPPAAA